MYRVLHRPLLLLLHTFLLRLLRRSLSSTLPRRRLLHRRRQLQLLLSPLKCRLHLFFVPSSPSTTAAASVSGEVVRRVPSPLPSNKNNP
ncbi:hypothetical protein Q3G72_004292 [Acer saccharum]|nr:hypothetical protein Q3G72_004292 [Acer saccharum]